MKLNLLILSAIIFIGTLACEKNANDNLIAPEPLNTDAPDVPQLGTKFRTVPEIIETLQPAADAKNTLVYQESRGLAELRGSYIKTINGAIKSISCGLNISGTLTDGTSKLNSDDYAAFRLIGEMDGRDDIYSITIGRSSIVTLNLRTTENLAMILFEGSATRNVSFGSTLNLRSAKDWTNSKSDYGDLVGPILLEPGTYVLVVDGPSRNESKYTLKMTCRELGTQTPDPNVLIKDDFDAYNVTSGLSPQADHWVKYDARSKDAEVIKSSSNINNKLAYFASENDDNVDVLLRTGTRVTGNWELKTKLWIPEGRTAKFSMIQRLMPGNTGNTVGAQIYFRSNGTGLIMLPGSDNNITFSYPRNKWMELEFELDFGNNKARLKIDRQQRGEWPANLTNSTTQRTARLEAFHFSTSYGNAQFFLDDLTFSKM
jgi:hypothetical protein